MLTFSGTTRLWEPTRTGFYNADCAEGREHAKEVISEMRKTGNPALLSHIVKCFDNIQGHEIGFLYQISLELITPQTTA